MAGLIQSVRQCSILGVLFALIVSATNAQPAPPAPLKFDSTGAQVGEQLPNLPVYDLNGKPGRLSELWAYRTGVLLLTSSLTCPKSRSSYPHAEKLANQLGNEVPVEIIYVLEAHPKGDPSPYRGYEDVTAENRRDGILCPQPTTLPERVKLANRFKDRLHVKTPIHVDGMDNAVWTALGGGPNMGVLVDSDGIVVARQGWFDAHSMQDAADAFLVASRTQRTPKLRSARDQELDAQLQAARIEPWQAARKFEDTDPAAAFDLLKRFPGLAQYTTQEGNRFTHGETILALATKGGDVPLIEAILSQGGDVHAQNASSPSPLHVAAKAGNQAAVELLIKHGADVNLKAPAGPMPLQEAAIYGHRQVVDLLLKSGAKPNFFFEVASEEIELVRQALQADRSRAVRPDGWDRTPFDYAAATGQIEMLKLLQSFGASDEPGRDFEHDPAVLWAAQQRQYAAVDFLLGHGDDPNAVGTWGDTLLHVAADKNDVNLARISLRYKPNVQVQDIAGRAALHVAVETHAYDMASLLLSGGADPNVGTGPERGPCAPFGDDGTLETPLQLAAEAPDLRMIQLLIGSGAAINARDRSGWTALHHAVSAGQPETDKQRMEAVQFLIAHGADVNAKTSDGRTPLDVTNHEALVPVLKEHGAKQGDSAQ